MTHSLLRLLLICLLGTLIHACSALTVGRPFQVNPLEAIKIGYDTQKDVLQKMGTPQRRVVDHHGRDIFTYFWADGKGEGASCTIAFNRNQIVYVLEVSP